MEEETFAQKAIRKTKEQPLVPLGFAATVGFLLTGFRAYQRGDKHRSQMMMRGRIVAQAVTVIAMGMGAYFGIKPHNRPVDMEEKMDNMKKEHAK